jgi:hypothetical protein
MDLLTMFMVDPNTPGSTHFTCAAAIDALGVEGEVLCRFMEGDHPATFLARRWIRQTTLQYWQETQRPRRLSSDTLVGHAPWLSGAAGPSLASRSDVLAHA